MLEEICEWLHNFEPKTWLWNIPANRYFIRISDSTHTNTLIRSLRFLRCWSLDLRMNTHGLLHAHYIGSSKVPVYLLIIPGPRYMDVIPLYPTLDHWQAQA